MALRNVVGRVVPLACAVVLLFAVSSGRVNAQPVPKPGSTAHVYVFTGFGGAGKSYIDGVADRVRQRGLPTTVSVPDDASAVATSTAESYKHGRVRSIVIVGYSMGGGAAIKMAAGLAAAN